MKVLLFIFGLVIAFGGGQALYTNLTNSKSASYTLEEYSAQRPKDKWLELKDCQFNVVDASFEKSFASDRPKEVYIPIRPPEAPDGAPVIVLLATKDDAILDMVETMNGADSEEEVMKFIVANADKLLVKRDVNGMVRFGIEMQDKDRRELLKLQSNLVEDFILLDEGGKPSWVSVLGLPAGLAMLGFVFFGGRTKSPPPLPPAQAMPPSQPQAPTGPPPLG